MYANSLIHSGLAIWLSCKVCCPTEFCDTCVRYFHRQQVKSFQHRNDENTNRWNCKYFAVDFVSIQSRRPVSVCSLTSGTYIKKQIKTHFPALYRILMGAQNKYKLTLFWLLLATRLSILFCFFCFHQRLMAIQSYSMCSRQTKISSRCTLCAFIFN